MSVNDCVAVPVGLNAVKESGYVPPVPTAGVPDSVPVPFPLSTKVTPAGSVPLTEIAGSGMPIAVTVKVPGVPTVNDAILALVMAGF